MSISDVLPLFAYVFPLMFFGALVWLVGGLAQIGKVPHPFPFTRAQSHENDAFRKAQREAFEAFQAGQAGAPQAPWGASPQGPQGPGPYAPPAPGQGGGVPQPPA